MSKIQVVSARQPVREATIHHYADTILISATLTPAEHMVCRSRHWASFGQKPARIIGKSVLTDTMQDGRMNLLTGCTPFKGGARVSHGRACQ